MFYFLRTVGAARQCGAGGRAQPQRRPPRKPLATLPPPLAVGDIAVHSRIPFAPFTKITEVTGGWSNHVAS